VGTPSRFIVAVLLALLSGPLLAVGASPAKPGHSSANVGTNAAESSSVVKKNNDPKVENTKSPKSENSGKPFQSDGPTAADQEAFIAHATTQLNLPRSEVEKLYLQYEGALSTIDQDLPIGSRHQVTRDFVLARATNNRQIRPLPGVFNWLSVRLTGEEARDKNIVKYSEMAASMVFSRPISHGGIAVLGTGLRAETLGRIDAIARKAGTESTALLHTALADKSIDWDSEKSWQKLYAADSPIRAFENKLLIMATHHGTSNGVGNDAYIVVSKDGGETAQVPVPVLRRIAAQANVELFILACSTADSSEFGTKEPITSEQAVDGLAKLFHSPVATHGDVFSRLASEGIDLVFDARLVVYRRLTLIDKVLHNEIGHWYVPDFPLTNVSPTKGPIAAGNFEKPPILEKWTPSFYDRITNFLAESFGSAFKAMFAGFAFGLIIFIAGALSSIGLPQRTGTRRRDWRSQGQESATGFVFVFALTGGFFAALFLTGWTVYGLAGAMQGDGARALGGFTTALAAWSVWLIIRWAFQLGTEPHKS
jgi:hypothetical protein